MRKLKFKYFFALAMAFFMLLTSVHVPNLQFKAYAADDPYGDKYKIRNLKSIYVGQRFYVSTDVGYLTKVSSSNENVLSIARSRNYKSIWIEAKKKGKATLTINGTDKKKKIKVTVKKPSFKCKIEHLQKAENPDAESPKTNMGWALISIKNKNKDFMYDVYFSITLKDSAGNELFQERCRSVKYIPKNGTGYRTLSVYLSSDEWEHVDLKKSTIKVEYSYNVYSSPDDDEILAISARDYSKKLSIKKVGTGYDKNIWILKIKNKEDDYCKYGTFIFSDIGAYDSKGKIIYTQNYHGDGDIINLRTSDPWGGYTKGIKKRKFINVRLTKDVRTTFFGWDFEDDVSYRWNDSFDNEDDVIYE